MKTYLQYTVTVVVSLLFIACSNSKNTENQEKTVPVRTLTVFSDDSSLTRQTYVGSIEESAAVALSFAVAGTVEQVLVAAGQKVTKGQLLATVNTTTAQNAFDAAQATLSQAQDAYNRLVKLHENGSLPDIKFVEVETGLQQAKSMAAITRKALDDCRLYAPQSGMIASCNIEAGANVLPGVQAIKLVAIEKVYAKIFVSENEIGSIHEGQTATLSVAALDNAVFTGKTEQKGIAANPISHTYEVKIGIANTQKNLLPGMVCNVTIDNVSSHPTSIAVPNRCIKVAADGKRYVWLVKDGVASRRYITTGGLTDSGIEVIEGLTAGEQVITDGFLNIGEGMRVKIENEKM